MKIFVILWLGLSFSLPSLGQARAKYSVLQGITDQTNVQFSVVHSGSEPMQFMARDAATGVRYEPATVQVAAREFSSLVVSKVSFKNLPSLMSGSLELEDAGGKLKESRSFKLLDTARRNIRIALVSCSAEYLYKPEMWEQLNSAGAEFVLFIGDNVYADRPNLVTKKPADPKQLWEQYIGARQRFDFFFRRDLVPSLATWDDHDFGKDDGDMHFKYAEDSRQVFSEFWAQDSGVSPLHTRGPGISSAFMAFGIQFVLLDDRSFRTGEAEVNPTSWGDLQKEWLHGLIGGGDQPMMIVNGEQFFGAYRGKYALETSYPSDMSWLLASIREGNRPAGFISGDIHYSEFMELEKELTGQLSVEITSSSMHSVTVQGQHNWFKNHRRTAATSAHNFIMLDLETDAEKIIGQASSIGEDGQFLFQRNLQIGGTERVIARTPGLKVLPVPNKHLRQKPKLRAQVPAGQRI